MESFGSGRIFWNRNKMKKLTDNIFSLQRNDQNNFRINYE